MGARQLGFALLTGMALFASGCASVLLGGGGPAPEPFRLSDELDAGDPAFRASLRLVLDGLHADADAQPVHALDLYERALQVDPTNPYAYLAIARHHTDGSDPASALPFVDKARALLEAQGALSPGVEAHLAGLRGSALLSVGQRQQAIELLDRARVLAPQAWSDGRLDATELR